MRVSQSECGKEIALDVEHGRRCYWYAFSKVNGGEEIEHGRRRNCRHRTWDEVVLLGRVFRK